MTDHPSEPTVLELPTEQGPSRVHLFAADARGLVVLSHGAGGGIGAADLQALRRLTTHGWDLALVEQPWRVAGRKIAVAPPRLDQAWHQIIPALLAAHPTERLVVGGRSAGARVACRTSPGAAPSDASEAPHLPRADGVLCLAFPLHPPGRPEKSRAEELAVPPAAGIPTLVVQGRSDPFGSPEEVDAAVPASTGPITVLPVPGQHSPTTSLVAMTTAVTTWLDGLP